MKSKKQVMEELNLDSLPDDDFMELYQFASTQSTNEAHSRQITPGEMTPLEMAQTVQTELILRSVGQLLSLARQQSGLSQAALAAEAGVGRSWINQAERKEYLELPSLVRLAGAMGYQVRISLEPTISGRKPLHADLGAPREPK